MYDSHSAKCIYEQITDNGNDKYKCGNHAAYRTAYPLIDGVYIYIYTYRYILGHAVILLSVRSLP